MVFSLLPFFYFHPIFIIAAFIPCAGVSVAMGKQHQWHQALQTTESIYF